MMDDFKPPMTVPTSRAILSLFSLLIRDNYSDYEADRLVRKFFADLDDKGLEIVEKRNH
jgi:hypothetical protein